MRLHCSKSCPPLGGIITSEHVNAIQSTHVDIVWDDETFIENGQQRIPCDTLSNVPRIIARQLAEKQLYGASPVEKAEVDSWLTFSLEPLTGNDGLNSLLLYLEKVLKPATYLVGKRVTIADFAMFALLYGNDRWTALIAKNQAPSSVLRWFNHLKELGAVKKALDSLPAEAKTALQTTNSKRASMEPCERPAASVRPQEGKFIELPGAEMGKVVVRFPPEASGYLHIGHAKAALLNQYYQQAFNGKLIMRFDDTNPAKENVEFEKVILEDLEMLEVKPDRFTHTSNYFDLMLEYCEKLLKDGKAYVDDTEPEVMKQEREQRVESANRSNDVKKNLALWEEMVKGTDKGQTCCVRAKIDMQSPNGCLRDPTIYRCKNESHPRTGDKYKVYPTYDFACPIVDAIEGVTHTLRTMEYHDRDPQFYWFIDALNLRKPIIWEYSRLSMTNTVLSKRKLTWFVENGLVEGWDDPRFPTVRGVLRRGMTVEGLKQFIIAQGSSRSVVFMEWDKIWAFNKKIIDPIAPRYTALEFANPVIVLVKDVKEQKLTVPCHPKNPEVGEKSVWIGPKVLIDLADAKTLKCGENVTFINWGNLLITGINRDDDGTIESVEAEPNLDNKDYKKTLKITWLADVKKTTFTPTTCVYFEHIISKSVLGKDEDFKQYIGHETKREVKMLGDPELRNLKKGDIIQLQRRGFFKVDRPSGVISLHTCKELPVLLFAIPDGHTKENPTAGAPKSTTTKQATNKPSEIKKEVPTKPGTQSNNRSANDINSAIIAQGDKVRQLKTEKATKEAIDAQVKVLLTLKSDYKQLTGADWKPGVFPPSVQASPVGIEEINGKIVAQGDKIRQLKAEKATKDLIEPEVKVLLTLKSDYKQLTGADWKPGVSPPSVQARPVGIDEINGKIVAQGDKIRQLKAEKATKDVIEPEVKVLLSLKADYKQLSGNEWKPDAIAVKPPTAIKIENAVIDEVALRNQIAQQGNKVRQLKTEKAAKSLIDAEVKLLLSHKEDYKKLTGKEWTPNDSEQPPAPAAVAKPKIENENDALTERINQQGEVVRKLKAEKASKEAIELEVKKLLELKAEYKQVTGNDFPSAGKAPSKSSSKKVANAPKPQKAVLKNADEAVGVKKQTRLGLEARKEENLSDWYSQVITKGELIEYYDVSGCYIFRPWSYAIWEAIKDWFDAEIKKLGVQNCYFPIFVSRSALEKEKTHIADFAPEVAWVTKSGDSEMAEPVAVRPTSETVMYPAYAKWIQSYRDLPIKLNQWNNVVRWEFKHPQPFLRTREFLWQEGHTAHASKQDATDEVKTILDLYAQVFTDLLAIPVIKGRKTEKEKFAGAEYTLTAEAFISASGRAIQGATSHHLAQNFSKMFEIVYDDPETQEKRYVFQNSWGITTRTIGVMIMVHADNRGLVLPPRVASIQVVIVPCGITVSLPEDERVALQFVCDALEEEFRAAGIRVKGDYRSNYSPGWKFNHWELKGVPIRVELGPKDIEQQQVVAVRRDTGEKIVLKKLTATQKLLKMLDNIQQTMFNKANEDMKSHVVTLTDWSKFTPNLDKKNIILAPFCGDITCEDQIKTDSTRDEEAEPGAPSMGAKSLCTPLDAYAVEVKAGERCIHPQCKKPAVSYTLFGRSY